VEKFEAQIQQLKHNATGRTMIVTSIDQEIELVQKDYEALKPGYRVSTSQNSLNWRS
jgi:hypothetical protein